MQVSWETVTRHLDEETQRRIMAGEITEEEKRSSSVLAKACEIWEAMRKAGVRPAEDGGIMHHPV